MICEECFKEIDFVHKCDCGLLICFECTRLKNVELVCLHLGNLFKRVKTFT